MKKVFRFALLVILLVVIGINRVNASTYNGKLYEVWDTDSGVNVYAAESNGWMDYNSWMVKSTKDNGIYYCIDPATPLEGASTGSHNYIYEKSELISMGLFTNNQYKKVSYLAYYGYGYKDEYTDHTDKKWYGITQVMIWRVMRPDLTWTFKKTRNGSASNSYFASEVAELNNLVDKAEVLPSFNGKMYRLLKDTSITIEDTNGVFHQYVKNGNNSKYTTTKSGNKLTIYSNAEPGEYAVSYKTDSYTNNTLSAFVSSDFQDVIRRGNLPELYMGLHVEVYGGTVSIQKLDADTDKKTPQGDATFKDAIYEIYNEEGNSVGKITTDENGTGKISLDYGNYTMKEVKAPTGYELSNKEYSFTISSTNYDIHIDVTDKVIKGRIKIEKTKGGSGEEFTPEEGAMFDIIDKTGKVIETIKTNNKGLSIDKLPYGKYTIHQIKGEDGYLFANDFDIELYEDKIYEYDIKDLKLSKLEFTKLDYSLDIPVPNALMEIYKEDDTLIYQGKTDKKGMISLPGLAIGKYYILEKEAPKYYRLNPDKMYFEVTENGQIIKSTMKDKRQEGSLKIIKKDSKTGEYLKDVEFNIYFMETNKVMFKSKTDEHGEININPLVAGKYCIKEIKTNSGYNISNDKHCFEIEKEGQSVTVVIKNDKKLIKVPKTGAFTIIPIIAGILIIIGSSYFIYEKFN